MTLWLESLVQNWILFEDEEDEKKNNKKNNKTIKQMKTINWETIFEFCLKSSSKRLKKILQEDSFWTCSGMSMVDSSMYGILSASLATKQTKTLEIKTTKKR